jgi:hypothetical protein
LFNDLAFFSFKAGCLQQSNALSWSRPEFNQPAERN